MPSTGYRAAASSVRFRPGFAVLSVLWICYPRFRVLYVLAALAVIAGLVGANFHFLGDTIAGAFLGSTIGWITVTLCDRLSSAPLISRTHSGE